MKDVKRNKQVGSLAMVGFVVVMFSIVGLVLGCAVSQAQWRTGAQVKSYEAQGTVMEKYSARLPRGENYKEESIYLRVVFKTDDKTTFVIPFRNNDIEAIPDLRQEYQVVAGSNVSSSCDAHGCNYFYSSPSSLNYETVQLTNGGHSHGILRYHLCDGYLYCFDSFTETAVR